MKKIQNDPFQVTGIILSLLGIAMLVRPLIEAVFGKALVFQFFGIVPDGTPAFIVWVVILVIGLVLVSITKPLKNGEKEEKA